jgi:hypothetical protein
MGEMAQLRKKALSGEVAASLRPIGKLSQGTILKKN